MAAASVTSPPLLRVESLDITFESNTGASVHAVRGASLSIAQREVVGLVGESGSGKSSLALGIANLLGSNAKVEGDVIFAETAIREMSGQQRRHLWGEQIGTVFQDPTSALNPLMTIGAHV